MAKEYGIITEPTSLSTYSNHFEMGWAFTVGAEDVRVVGLRAKLPAAQDITGNLWSNSGTLLSSCSITVVAGQWVEAFFNEPVMLNAHTQYVISCYNNANRYYSKVSAFTYNPKIASVQGGRYTSTKGAFPTGSEVNEMYPLIDIIIDDTVDHVAYGTVEFATELLRSIDSIAGSKITWTEDLPEGTSISVYSRLSSGSYGLCTNGGSLSGVKPGSDYSAETLFIKVEMSTTDPLLTPTLSDLFVQLLAQGDDRVLILSFNPGNVNSIQNAAGDITVAYDGSGTLKGQGGPVLAFEHTFTPVGLIPKNNQHDMEHIEISSIQAFGRLDRIYYHGMKATEHIGISNIEAVGRLIRVDDI